MATEDEMVEKTSPDLEKDIASQSPEKDDMLQGIYRSAKKNFEAKEKEKQTNSLINSIPNRYAENR